MIKKKYKMDLQFIALILIGLGSVGGILLVVAQSKSSAVDKSEIITSVKSENKTLKTTLNKLYTESDNLKKVLKYRDEKIQNQNSKIDKLNTKLLDKSEYIESYLSGGTSYPRVEITVRENAKENILDFKLINPFDSPIYNIMVQIYDYDEVENKAVFYGRDIIKTINMDDYFNSQIVDYKYDLLAPLTNLISIGKLANRSANLYIKIHTRNMILVQKFIILKKENSIYFGYEIYDLKTNKLIKSAYNPGCPENIKTEINEKLNLIPEKLPLKLN